MNTPRNNLADEFALKLVEAFGRTTDLGNLGPGGLKEFAGSMADLGFIYADRFIELAEKENQESSC